MNVEPERVAFWINFIGLHRIIELFQDITRPNPPTLGTNSDKSGWMIVGLEQVVGLHMGREVLCHKLLVLSARLQELAYHQARSLTCTHDNDSFAPATVPVPRYEPDPVSLAPDTGSDGYLEIAFQRWFGYWEGTGASSIPLKSIHHGLEVPFLRSLHGWSGSPVGSHLQQRVLGIVFLHGIEVVWAFEQV